MNETLSAFEAAMRALGLGRKKRETAIVPATVVRDVKPEVKAALTGGAVANPPTGEAAKPLPTDGTFIVSGPTAKG